MKMIMINETRSYKKLVQVHDFAGAFRHLFPAGSVAADLFDMVARSVEALSGYAASQVTAIGADRGSKNQLAAARADLRRHLRAISDTARAAAVDSSGLEDKFFLPRGRLSDQKLLACGHAFLKDVEPLAGAFIQHEMPPDFLEQLKEHVRNFEQALDERAGGGELRGATRSNIEAMVRKGLAAIERLDPIVRNKFHNDAVSLAAWDRALHVQHANRQKTPAAPDTAARTVEPQQ